MYHISQFEPNHEHHFNTLHEAIQFYYSHADVPLSPIYEGDTRLMMPAHILANSDGPVLTVPYTFEALLQSLFADIGFYKAIHARTHGEVCATLTKMGLPARTHVCGDDEAATIDNVVAFLLHLTELDVEEDSTWALTRCLNL